MLCRTRHFSKKETILSTWKARRHNCQRYCFDISASISFTHTHIHTYIEPLVQTTGADPLRERDFHVACSSSVRGVSASLAGDRNLNQAYRCYNLTTTPEKKVWVVIGHRQNKG